MTAASVEGRIDPAQAERVAGILGVDPPADVLPPMWHLAQLVERWPRAALGLDGHPLGGVPIPPAEPHRRMFAGGRATHVGLLQIGEPARRRSTVVSTTTKDGRSGRLTFVTVRHEFEQRGEIVVSDEHDLVYRPWDAAAGGSPSAAAAPAAGEELDDAREFEVDPVTLFLFSAVTANAHRIHYDAAYARTEGHPDLVVHGPLHVILMAEALHARGDDLRGKQFAYRLLRPAYGAQRLRVGVPSDADVAVLDGAGHRVARGDLS
ncbi:hypothetical protein ACTU3I_04265 [Microbacterium sp. RD1]|uniref:hypothetical protein n=1 Tax=Microbacterium sp. RD1 TaxID=3457313 RepID=UPI003FA5E32F